MTPDDRRSDRPLLIAGMPRSGTTWTMQVLATDPHVHALLEPDNEGICAPAIWGKRGAGRFPALRPGDRDDDYRDLWRWILSGARLGIRLRLAAQVMRLVQPPQRTRFLQGHRVPAMEVARGMGGHPGHRPDPASAERRVLVKTVHAPLSLEWLCTEFDVAPLVLLRHPGNVLASWLDLGLNEQFVHFWESPAVTSRYTDRWGVRPPGPDPVERMIWQIGVLTKGLEEAVQRHPEWTVRRHEALCQEPAQAFRTLFAEVGLTWGPATDDYLRRHDRHGEGFRTDRVAAELPESWKQRLSAPQIDALHRILEPFQLDLWRNPGGAGAPPAPGQAKRGENRSSQD